MYNVITIGEFAEKIKCEVSTVLTGCEIKIDTVTKNNGINLTALIISQTGKHLSPVIYLNELYENFRTGTELNNICKTVLKLYDQSLRENSSCLPDITDIQKISDRICLKIINTEQNRELLKTIPHRPFYDLAVVYYILLDKNSKRHQTVLVNNNFLCRWGVNETFLYEKAKENTPRLLKGTVLPMSKVISHLTAFDFTQKHYGELYDMEISGSEDEILYMAGNVDGLSGAGILLYKDVLKDFARLVNHDFYILPSSVNELIFMPVFTKDIQAENLIDMVRDINATVVNQKDFLSDNVYYYHKDEDFLEMISTL